MRMLNGWWRATAGELGGVRLPEEALLDLPFGVCSGAFVLGSDRGRLVLHRYARPYALDIVPTVGSHRGRVVPAIIDLTRSELRLCCDLSGTERPATFCSPPGSRHFLVTYRRGTNRTLPPRETVHAGWR